MDKFLKFQKKNIRYRDNGSGQCVVLLHGFTESLEIWNNFAKKLSNKYRIITIDLPGHGKTDCFNNIHTMSFMADIVNIVIKHLKIKKILLIGHSMGGYVSLEFAQKYPKKLAGLGLFHSHAFDDDDNAKLNRDRVINVIKSDKFNFLNHFIPDLFKQENRIIYKNQIKKLMEMSAKYMTNSGLIAALEGMKIRNCHISTINNLENPVFYIIGQHDSRIEPKKVIEQAMLSKDCWLQVINTGHMGYIEASKQTFNFIYSFCNYTFN